MKKTTAIFALFLAAFTWGSAFCVLKDTLENVSPIWLLAFRFLLAGIIMTLVCIPRMKKMSIRTLKRGIIMGIVLYFEFLFFTVGLQYTTSSKSSFIIGSYVAILPLIYWVIRGKKPQRADILAALVCIVGLGFILLGSFEGVNKGDLISLLSAVCYAIHIVVTGIFAREEDGFLLNMLQIGTGGILGLVAAMILAAGSVGTVAGTGAKQVQAAENAYYYVSLGNLQQTAMTKNSASITWEQTYASSMNTLTTEGYNIYLGESYSDMKLVGKSKTPSYTLTGLKDGKRYNVRVEAYTSNGTKTSSPVSGQVETIPAAVHNFRQERWWYFINKLEVTWDKVETADRVEVTLYNSKGRRVGKTQKLNSYAYSASFDKMKDEVYTVTIQAFKTVNGKTYATPKAKIQCFNQARIKETSIKVKKGSLSFQWGKVGGASGYDVYISTKPKKGYKKVKSVGKNTTKLTIRKFKGKKINPKKTYYMYVETKKKNGSKVNKSGRLYYWNTKSKNFGYF